MDEIWKAIPGFEGIYEVSSKGRMKSLPRTVTHGASGYLTIRGRILKYSQSGKYPSARLYLEGEGVNRTIHRLVAEAFIPNPGDLPLVLHKDDNPENYGLENLKWGTVEENSRDAKDNKRNANLEKKECKRGHPLSGRNLVESMLPHRSCKACSRERARAHSRSEEFNLDRANEQYLKIIQEEET